MRRNILVAIVLALVTVAVYWPVFHAEFLNFDDPLYVTNNPEVWHGLSLKAVGWAFCSFHASNWHPVTWLSHMLDCQVSGQNAAWHHLVNVFLHLANSLLLLAVLHRMTGAFWRSTMVAGLFALHPLHVESVAWIAERKDVLCAFFGLLSLWAYGRYAECRSPGSASRTPHHEPRTTLRASILHLPSTIFYLLSLSFFALGLMSKPMLVTLPFVLLLLDYWPLGKLVPTTPEPRNHRFVTWRVVCEKWPFFILSAASCVVTVIAQARGGAIVGMDKLPLPTRLLNAVIAYTGYLKEALWPKDLAAIYPLADTWPMRELILAMLVLLAGSLLAIAVARRLPYLFVGWFWYVGTLIPVIGIVQVGLQAMADRYTYLPLIGVFLAAVWGTADWLRRWRHGQAVAMGAGCLILTAYAVVTRHQVEYWRNSTVLFQHTIEVSPQCFLAHHHLGLACMTSAKYPEALEHLNEAIRLQPNYPRAWFSRGTAFGLVGQLEPAMSDFREAIRLKPDYHQAYFQLGKVLALHFRLAEAQTNFLEAVRLKPAYAEAQALLGNVLQLEGKVDEAMPHLKAAVIAQPDYAEGHYYLATALSSQRKLPEAAAHLESALRYKPDFPNALNDLSLILVAPDDSGLRNLARGAQLAEKACKLTGYQEPFCLQTLAIACAEAGRVAEAKNLAQRAFELATAKGNSELAARLRSQLEDLQAKEANHENLR
jgi:protein O-mannosyl-transferase